MKMPRDLLSTPSDQSLKVNNGRKGKEENGKDRGYPQKMKSIILGPLIPSSSYGHYPVKKGLALSEHLHIQYIHL